jgi:DNA-binding SARP family transcriptional activator
MALRVSVTGVVELQVDGAQVDLSSLGRVGRHFWAYLVCERHRPVAKDELADALWGEDLPRSWDQMLRGNASKLRTILAGAGLEPAVSLKSAFGTYQLVLLPDAVVDVEEAALALESAGAVLDIGGDADEAYRAASQAVSVAARGFLAGWPGTWVEQRQSELRDLRVRGLELVSRAAAATGRWGEAVAAVEEAVAVEPFRESAHQLLMESHRGAGNPAEALRAYERCRRLLAEELGVSPAAATERIYLALLEDESAATGGDDPSLPLPPLLAPSSAGFLVGRAIESGRLAAALDRLAVDGRQAVLVAGEPGIGKTTLVSDFARTAYAGGARVLYGRCDEELGVAYQPFAEALGQYVAHCPLAELSAHVAAHGTHVSRITSELLRRLPDAPHPPTTASEADRYRLFEAVTDLVTRASRPAPVVLVLDDLHWAAPPTVSLLGHVVRARPPSLLVLGTYRHTEVGSDHALAATLADLWREPGVDRILLAGLDEDGVSALVERVEGHALDAADHALARALHARTAGNPFFVGEFLRHLSETGGVYQKEGRWTYYENAETSGVPEGVRDVIARRLQRLSASANTALTVASVVGFEFDLRVLERVSGPVPEDATLDALDEAVAAHVVAEVGSGRYQFAHALVRDTIYSTLTSTRRARLHHRVGDALASIPGDTAPRLPALAHHFAEAASDGAATQAGRCALAAARQAFDHSAWEDVLVFVRAALGVLSSTEAEHLELRFELLLVEHETLLVVVDLPSAGRVLREAVDTARRLGSPEIMARALALYLLSTGITDPRRVGLAEEARQSLGDSEPRLRSRLLAGLAMADHLREPSGSERRTRDALALARESEDAEAVYVALVARRHVLADSPYAKQWLAVEEELTAMGPVTRPVAGTRWMYSLGRGRAAARLVLGDRAAFEVDVDRLERLTREMRNRGGGWHMALYRAALALMDGRFDEVDALAAAAFAIGPTQFGPRAIQLCKLALEQGRAAEIEGEVLTVVPDNVILAAMLGCVYAESGRPDDAVRILEDLAHDEFLRVMRGGTSTALVYLAEVVSAVGERKWAPKLYDRLLPYSGLAAFSGYGAHCPGAVDRYLGQLSATLGRYDDAEHHYDAALAFETGLRSPPLLARTRYWYGRMLLDRDQSGDADRAGQLLKSAVETAELLGMSRLAVQASALAGA